MVATLDQPLSHGDDFADVVGERPFTEWTGRSTLKVPTTAMGREQPVNREGRTIATCVDRLQKKPGSDKRGLWGMVGLGCDA